MSDLAAFREVLDVLTVELSEDQLINTAEENGCGEKDEASPEERMPAKNLTFSELLEIIHNIEHAKNKMLEADPNLGSSVSIHHGMERMSTPYPKSHDKMSTVRAILDKFSTKTQNSLIINVSDVLNDTILNNASFIISFIFFCLFIF